jgi:hypothetical protein
MMMRCLPAIKAALLLGFASLLAGCAGGLTTASNSYAQIGTGTTVAFESIDGPPPHVFQRMVGLLDIESKARNVSVVSREAPAAYRVRSYLSAQIHGNRTVIAWVWDVYDRDGQRALRLSGEEAGTKSGRDAWSAADDALLRRIAQSGLTGLNGIASGGAPVEPQPAAGPRDTGPAIASVQSMPDSTALSFSTY